MVAPQRSYFDGGELWEIPNILKKLAEVECKEAKPNMVELKWWEHVETMYLKNGKNAKIQLLFLRGEMVELQFL